MQSLTLYLSTLRHYKPSQLFLKLIKRFKTNSFFNVNFNINNINVLDGLENLDLNVQELKNNIEDIMNDKIVLLNSEQKINWDIWNYNNQTRLWNFNLNYFEYLFVLVYKYRQEKNENYITKLKFIIEKWIANNKDTSKDSWHPYVVSLRLTNLLYIYSYLKDSFSKDIKHTQLLVNSMYAQYIYLRNNLEKDLLANHYFENIKTLLLCSLFFNDINSTKKYIELLKHECDEQILNDGMHYELSFMYHNIVLEGLIRVTHSLKYNNIDYEWCIKYVQKMLNVTYSFCNDINRLPLFNDCGNNVSKHSDTLIMVCKKYLYLKCDFISNLNNAGYFLFKNNNRNIIVDVGKLGPKYQTGHSHCDCLSFELFINGKPLFVNCGTYNYQTDLRHYFRSTSSHNTIVVDGKEQSQTWAEHRVGKRLTDVSFTLNNTGLIGTYKTFSSVTIKREIIINDNSMVVIDRTNKGKTAKSYLHIPILYNVASNADSIIVDNNAIIECINSKFSIIEEYYSEDFGKLDKCYTIVFTWDCDDNNHGYKIVFNS